MTEFSTSSDDAFSPEEQAQFDAMRSGSPAPAPEAAPEPAAAPEHAPAPEAAAEAPEQPQEADEGEESEGEGETEGNKGQYVRREALRQERERRKSLQKELAEAREARARLDERLRIFAEATQKAAAPAEEQKPTDDDPEPNPEEDIFAHNRWIARQIAKRDDQARQQFEQIRAREEGERTLNSYKADAQRFAATEPTFPDAYNHLYRSRALELQHAGMTDTQQIMRAIAADEFQIAQQAIAQGVSPAQRIYEIAKARGFTPKAPEPAPEPKPVADTAAQKAERAAAGQRGPGRSLSSVGGAPAGGVPTVEQLASMSEEDFAKFAKNNPGAVTALMGG